METFRIAELSVNMCCDARTAPQAEKYKIAFTDKPDVRLIVTQKAIEDFLKEHPETNETDYHYITLCAQFSSFLLSRNGLVLHSSAVEYENNAYLFSASSGTGKSTHTRLWQQCFKEAKIINDDKPAIRLMEDDRFYVYGTPWSGSSPLNLNIKVPLKAICFIEQADKNSIERLSARGILPLFLSQTLRRTGLQRTNYMLDLLEKLIERIPFYRLKCLPNEDAARLAHSIMSK